MYADMLEVYTAVIMPAQAYIDITAAYSCVHMHTSIWFYNVNVLKLLTGSVAGSNISAATSNQQMNN